MMVPSAVLKAQRFWSSLPISSIPVVTAPEESTVLPVVRRHRWKPRSASMA